MSRESDPPEAEPDLEFATAADLRKEATDGPDEPAGEEPDFSIPSHPERTFPRVAGVEYEGGTVFELRPEPAADEAALATLARDVLDDGPYRWGDWFDLPLPVFLVHDDDTGDTFRVAVRDGAVELHVRPETAPAGLRAFHDRLVGHGSDDAGADRHREWTVTAR